MHIVVTGSLGYDYIMDFSGRFADRIMPDKLHKISLSFLAETFHRNFGGTAVNIAYSLKLLEIEPTILATAGNDFSPYKNYLEKHQISTTYIKEYRNESTGTYFCVTDQEDNQIGAFYAGATKYAKELSIKNVILVSEGMYQTVRPEAHPGSVLSSSSSRNRGSDSGRARFLACQNDVELQF